MLALKYQSHEKNAAGCSKGGDRWITLLLQSLEGYGIVEGGANDLYSPLSKYPKFPIDLTVDYPNDLPPRGIQNPLRSCSIVAVVQALAACPPLAHACVTQPRDKLEKTVTPALHPFIDLIGKLRGRGDGRKAISGPAAAAMAVLSLPQLSDKLCRTASLHRLFMTDRGTEEGQSDSLAERLLGFHVHQEKICDTCQSRQVCLPSYTTVAECCIYRDDVLLSVERLLDDYTTPMKLDERCSETCPGILYETNVIASPPNVLVLALERPKKLDSNDSPVSLPLKLNLTPFIHENSVFAAEKNDYDLTSFIIEDGATEPHCVAVCRHGDQWYLCNDQNVKQLDDAELQQYLHHPRIDAATFTRRDLVRLTSHNLVHPDKIRQTLPPISMLVNHESATTSAASSVETSPETSLTTNDESSLTGLNSTQEANSMTVECSFASIPQSETVATSTSDQEMTRTTTETPSPQFLLETWERVRPVRRNAITEDLIGNSAQFATPHQARSSQQPDFPLFGMSEPVEDGPSIRRDSRECVASAVSTLKSFNDSPQDYPTLPPDWDQSLPHLSIVDFSKVLKAPTLKRKSEVRHSSQAAEFTKHSSNAGYRAAENKRAKVMLGDEAMVDVDSLMMNLDATAEVSAKSADKESERLSAPQRHFEKATQSGRSVATKRNWEWMLTPQKLEPTIPKTQKPPFARTVPSVASGSSSSTFRLPSSADFNAVPFNPGGRTAVTDLDQLIKRLHMDEKQS